MATINDYKVKDEDFNDLDIMSLPSRPSAAGMSAAQLQERFDAGSKQVIRPKLNALIDLLNGTEGADNIGIKPIEGLAGYTVQQFLVALKLLLDDKKSIESADREIGQKFDASEAQALVKEISFSEGSGVFTITKYDGSVQTIDTAIEKVALDVRLDGQQFVLTLADGTEQRVDLSAFLTQTEVKGSETIALSIEDGAIVARLATGSIQKMHLSDALIEYIEGKEGLAAESAAAAKVSEQNALNSANAAKASEQAAKTCQEQACLCATQADSNRQAAEEAQDAAEKAAKEAQAIAGLPNGKLPVQNGGLYINSETTEEDKAEAQEALSELGYKVKTYTSLSDSFGIEVGSETIEGIMSVLPSGSILVTGITTKNANIFPITEGGTLVVTKSYSNRARFEFWAANSNVNNYWIGLHNAGYWSGWIELVNASKFLPLDGSVSMSGCSLGLLNNKSKIQAGSSGSIQLDAYDTANDENNRRTLLLYSKNAVDNLNKALRLVTRVDEAATYYNIYGEHNTELLATQIQSLIDSGVIDVGGFKSPIKSLLGTAAQTAVTGSGKGKLFITADDNNYGVTVVIDGVTLLDNADWKNGNLTAEFEFTKSFSLKGDSSSYPTRYVAVFY